MTYERAILILGFSVKNTPAHNAERARQFLRVCNPKLPLRYKVAAKRIIEEAVK